MKFFIKGADGKLVEASTDDVLNTNTVLYNEKGEALGRHTGKPTDPIAELTDTVKQLAVTVGSLGGIKEKQERIEAELAAYKSAVQRGIILPSGRSDSGLTADDEKELFAPYNLAVQGRSLMSKIAHPGYQIQNDDVRRQVAEYLVLFLKAAYFGDQKATAEMRKRYVHKTGSVDLGDHSNVFPVPDIVDSEILAFAREKSVVLQYARMWEMTSDKQSFPKEDTGVSVSWGNTTSESTPTVSEVELDAEELSAYAAVRNDTLADARSDIVSWLTEVMAEASGLELDDEAFNGDGSGSGCSGLLTSACGYSVTFGSGSTAFSDLDADKLSEMISKLDGLRKQGARFFMNGAILHYVRILKDSNNSPIFIDTVGSPVSGTIYGYPYSEVIKMTSTSAANTAFAIFGNLRYFMLGRRLDTTTLQVDPWGLWTTNRTRFKIYQRWGLNIGLSTGFVRLLTASS